jgi:hypothetical protein
MFRANDFCLRDSGIEPRLRWLFLDKMEGEAQKKSTLPQAQFTINLTPVSINPDTMVSVPSPVAGDPDSAPMRSCCPMATRPDPMAIPLPGARDPKPNFHRARCRGNDFHLRRWRIFRTRFFINYTAGQKRQTGYNNQRCFNNRFFHNGGARSGLACRRNFGVLVTPLMSLNQ